MSYFVLKGPDDCGQYLCDYRPVHTCPQWHYDRNRAFKFASAAEARAFATKLPTEHVGCGDWGTRAVRVVSKAERQAERKALRAVYDAAWQLVDGAAEVPPDTGKEQVEATLHCWEHEVRALRLAIRAVP